MPKNSSNKPEGWYKCFYDEENLTRYYVRYVKDGNQTYLCDPSAFTNQIFDDGSSPGDWMIYDSNISGFWKMERIA